jgi:hypothetical protein
LNAPVQLWASERGHAGAPLEGVANLKRGLPANTDYHRVPDAGHWAFPAPGAPEQAKANPKICVDAPDFDLVAFHKAFNVQLLAFFRAHLVETAGP